MTGRCVSCGQFVPNGHLKTARYCYDIDFEKPVSVYSLATATILQERFDCAGCSMKCCRMDEAERGYGIAIGREFPHGWIKCTAESTQDNVVPLEAS